MFFQEGSKKVRVDKVEPTLISVFDGLSFVSKDIIFFRIKKF